MNWISANKTPVCVTVSLWRLVQVRRSSFVSSCRASRSHTLGKERAVLTCLDSHLLWVELIQRTNKDWDRENFLSSQTPGSTFTFTAGRILLPVVVVWNVSCFMNEEEKNMVDSVYEWRRVQAKKETWNRTEFLHLLACLPYYKCCCTSGKISIGNPQLLA